MTRLMATRARSNRVPMLLLVAILPMLTFVGHWPANVNIPRTNVYITVPLAGGHAHDEQTPENPAEHARHCHGGVASCGDAPAGAGVSISLYQEPLILVSAELALIAMWLAGWLPRRPNSIFPELMPPRFPLNALNTAS